jgi:hypothetical protein
MTEKWKYMLKIGLFWAGFMTAFMLLFDYFDKNSNSPIVPWKILLRFGIYLIFGIGLGYLNWQSKEKAKK